MDDKIIELMQYYMLENGWNPGNNYSDNNGNSVLRIACQANKLPLVSCLIDQVHCDPNIKDKKRTLPLDMATNLEVIYYLCQHDQVAVYSKTIIKWISRFNDATLLCILQSLVDNHRTITKDHPKLSLMFKIVLMEWP